MSAQSPSPSVPSQPPKSAAYFAKPGHLTRNLSEFAVADTPGPGTPEPNTRTPTDYLDSRSSRLRTAQTHDDNDQPVPTAQGQGVRGGVPTNERERRETFYAPESENQGQGMESTEGQGEGEKMASATEGRVAEAVEKKPGTRSSRSHERREEFSLSGGEADYERKKAQQEIEREQIKRQRAKGVDVDGLGESGPARKPSVEV